MAKGANKGKASIFPYWLLLFAIGFAWFVPASLVPVLVKLFDVGLGSMLLAVSAFGYAVAVLGLVAGYVSAKYSIKTSLYLAAAITLVGLVGRAYAPNYLTFIIMDFFAAIGFPFALSPVGNVCESLYKEKAHTAVGISIGALFLGMAFGSLLGPSLLAMFGISGALWSTALLAAVAAIWVFLGIRGHSYYKGYSLKGAFAWGMLKNWYIGVAVAAIAVTFGSISATVLSLHNVANALELGGLLGGILYIGSSFGAIVLPLLFERHNAIKLGVIATGVLTFLSTIAMAWGLGYTTDIALIASGLFFFGFFGNGGFWSLALSTTANYAHDPAHAGFATAMFTSIANLGVGIIPVYLGVQFGSASTIGTGVSIVIGAAFVSMLLAPLLKAKSSKKRN
ncbi:MAG: MFS transporter [Candidatus Micrarchaeia archaeon]